MILSLSHWRAYSQLMRVEKPVGVYLLLWPTLWALWLAADGLPPIDVLLVFLAGVFLMRSAGCVINDYADRHIDGHVQRTKDRPLATGRVSPPEALQLFILLVMLAFALVLLLNWQTVVLSIGALLLAACYPFMKRYTHFPQVVLGAAFSWAVPMAFMAVQQQIPSWAWWLYGANVIWTVAYDTAYAMADRDDDRKVGVKSTAIAFGRFDRAAIALMQLAFLGIMAGLGEHLSLGWPYWSGLLVAAGFSLYQQWLIRERQPQRCFQAFLNNHYVGMAIGLGLIADLSL
ncbi:4-hydroxybenzoate polyprenyltransferase [Saliniradius amylolyticus]|uniref:4-hydroxybenzoate octaprenyltransferase n=1 Tax=Saliniradius amylolyticus TaxID=2183582 RepID=A0A2S2DYV2_9ALTE|nr:4-hydroxybenzoate octaprenyltransferase [Saliniradius amylolyticus]AWL10578.1 4-hydroxybenzoate polyprenyltransferase [Saliniradius amylolyticus]